MEQTGKNRLIKYLESLFLLGLAQVICVYLYTPLGLLVSYLAGSPLAMVLVFLPVVIDVLRMAASGEHGLAGKLLYIGAAVLLTAGIVLATGYGDGYAGIAGELLPEPLGGR
jgi:hypothetical protein